jgi:hypothetical protein
VSATRACGSCLIVVGTIVATCWIFFLVLLWIGNVHGPTVIQFKP